MRKKIIAPTAAKLAKGNAISKACAVLSTLSTESPLRLNEIAEATGLNRVTALRILEDLTGAGFLTRTGSPPRYEFGPEILAVAAASARQCNPRDLLRPGLLRLAATSGDTVLLSIRSGVESVCVDRQVGDFPIRANYLDIGSRRPLGFGAGSMALLASLPPGERSAALEITMGQLENYPRMSRQDLEDHIRFYEANGYIAMYDQIVDMMGAVGVPIIVEHGRILGSISIVGLTERIRARETMLIGAIRQEIRQASRS